jgi:hypothetical protein
MNNVVRDAQTDLSSAQQAHSEPQSSAGQRPPADTQINLSHPVFQSVWYAVNVLLILAVLLAMYSIVWEYSTRRYLQGFSEAIVPAAGPPQEKIEAVLNWMSHGPARRPWGPNAVAPDRDPTDTLNYDSLLRVCGTATNAFVNLADTAGLTTRRLLLLDSRQQTNHVVAEVLVDRRWIIVDPAFRVILRGADGTLLTREELNDPVTFAAATRDIPHYNPEYTFDRTAHIRMARFPFIGVPLRDALGRILPGWEDSTVMTLILERESFATMIVAICLVLLLMLLRAFTRWFGERRLGIRRPRLRGQLLRAVEVFFSTSS